MRFDLFALVLGDHQVPVVVDKGIYPFQYLRLGQVYLVQKYPVAPLHGFDENAVYPALAGHLFPDHLGSVGMGIEVDPREIVVREAREIFDQRRLCHAGLAHKEYFFIFPHAFGQLLKFAPGPFGLPELDRRVGNGRPPLCIYIKGHIAEKYLTRRLVAPYV